MIRNTTLVAQYGHRQDCKKSFSARQLQLQQLFSVFCLTTNRYCISNIIVVFLFYFLLFSFLVFSYPLSKVPVVFHFCPFQATSLLGQLDACFLTVLRLTSVTPSKSNPLTTAAVSSPTRWPNAAVQHPQRGRWLSKYRTVPLVPSTARSRGARRKVYRAIITATLNSPVYTPVHHSRSIPSCRITRPKILLLRHPRHATFDVAVQPVRRRLT